MAKMVKLGSRKIKGSTWDEGGKTEIVQILISHGKALVKSIQFVYAVDGKLVRSEIHGEPYGSLFDMVTLDYPNEYLVSIDGRYSSKGLVSIGFRSNNNRYGSFGSVQSVGSSFLYNFYKKSSFGGLHGSVLGSRVYRIGVYINPLVSIEETETKTENTQKK